MRALIVYGNLSRACFQDVAAWWWDRTFVEKRYPQTKDYLVRMTETAILMESRAFFQDHSGASKEDSEDGGGGGDEAKKKAAAPAAEESDDDGKVEDKKEGA